MIVQTSPSSVSLGDVSVSTDPATANTMQKDHGQILAGATKVITAGAYLLEVHCTGNESITVAGQKVEPNDRYQLEARYNQVTNRLDFCPETTVIVDPASSAYFVAFYPSV